MNRLLLLALGLSSSLLAVGCGCSAWSGDGDRVYQRGNDMLILCNNGGYTAVIGGADQEGHTGSVALADGPTGAIASALTYVNGAPVAFGDGAWTSVALDQVGLTHADTLCKDLDTRAWWNMAALPVNTTFAKVAADFATIDDCLAAQDAGAYPAGASCQDQLDLCVDGSSFVTLATGTIPGSYTAEAGTLAISQFAGATTSFLANGSLQISNQSDWSTKTVSPLAVSKCAK
jgi:hypothetical protein